MQRNYSIQQNLRVMHPADLPAGKLDLMPVAAGKEPIGFHAAVQNSLFAGRIAGTVASSDQYAILVNYNERPALCTLNSLEIKKQDQRQNEREEQQPQSRGEKLGLPHQIPTCEGQTGQRIK